MKRPFPVRYGPGGAPGEIRISCALGTPVKPDGPATLLRVLEKFGDYGALGGLSGDRIPPAESGLLPSTKGISAGTLDIVFSGAKIDPRSGFLLTNVLECAHEELVPLREATVAWQGLPMSAAGLKEEFPALYEPVPFELDIRFTRSEVDVQVELAKDESEDVIEALAGGIGSWIEVVGAGGFGDAGRAPRETEISCEDEPTLAPDEVFFSFAAVKCNDAAFDVLVNLLHQFHVKHAEIRKVTIG